MQANIREKKSNASSAWRLCIFGIEWKIKEYFTRYSFNTNGKKITSNLCHYIKYVAHVKNVSYCSATVSNFHTNSESLWHRHWTIQFSMRQSVIRQNTNRMLSVRISHSWVFTEPLYWCWCCRSSCFCSVIPIVSHWDNKLTETQHALASNTCATNIHRLTNTWLCIPAARHTVSTNHCTPYATNMRCCIAWKTTLFIWTFPFEWSFKLYFKLFSIEDVAVSLKTFCNFSFGNEFSFTTNRWRKIKAFNWTFEHQIFKPITNFFSAFFGGWNTFYIKFQIFLGLRKVFWAWEKDSFITNLSKSHKLWIITDLTI